LLLASVFPVLIGNFSYFTFCPAKCGSIFFIVLLCVGILFGFIALCILGQPLRDGCQHTRACWGYAGSSDCQGDEDRLGALNCIWSYDDSDREGLKSCGQKHWDHFEDDSSHHTGDGTYTFWGFETHQDCRDYFDVEEKVNEALALVLVTGLVSCIVRSAMVYFLVTAGFEHSESQIRDSPGFELQEVVGRASGGAGAANFQMASAVAMVAPGPQGAAAPGGRQSTPTATASAASAQQVQLASASVNGSVVHSGGGLFWGGGRQEEQAKIGESYNMSTTRQSSSSEEF
jgi:hypothetical protein